jgi:hypothetical protein
VWTEKFYVQNIGRKPAHNVEIVFNMIPTSYNLFPTRDHQKIFLENGFFSLKLPAVAPSELVVIDIIDLDARNFRLESVSCADVIAREVDFLPTRQFGSFFNFVVGYLLLAGFLGTVYFLSLTLLGS